MLGIYPESTRNFRNFRTHILLFEVLLHSTRIHPESPESGESDQNMWGTVKHWESAPFLVLAFLVPWASGPLGQMEQSWHASVVHAAVVFLMVLSLSHLSTEVDTTTSVLWLGACPAPPDLHLAGHLPGPVWPPFISTHLRHSTSL